MEREPTVRNHWQFLQYYMLITYVLGYAFGKLIITIEMCLETNDGLHWTFAKLKP